MPSYAENPGTGRQAPAPVVVGNSKLEVTITGSEKLDPSRKTKSF